jgi:hypothetical protein
VKGLAAYKDTSKDTSIHRRSIVISTYPAGLEAIMIEGVLKDERLRSIFSISTGEEIGPGVIHEIVLRLLIRGTRLTIDDMEVEYLHMPRTECHKTSDSLRGLIGQNISTGFTSLVKKTFGGPKGCTHLNALLIAMAPAVVQGFWSSVVSRRITPAQASKSMDAGLLIDSCWVWRSDGPLAREFQETLKNHDK